MKKSCYIFILLNLFSGIVNAQTKCTSKFDTVTKRQIYMSADSMPKFPKNGNAGMFAFISENIKHQEGFVITGTVYVSFVVETDGTLKHKKIIKGITADTNKEALSIIDKMPDWIPGFCEGKKVPVQMIIPIKYVIR